LKNKRKKPNKSMEELVLENGLFPEEIARIFNMRLYCNCAKQGKALVMEYNYTCKQMINKRF